MSTSKQLYCSECDAVTEHVKVSYADIQAMKKLADQKAKKNDGILSQIYQKQPEWLKDINFGTTAIAGGIFNGLSNYFLGKDYSSLWICSKCHNPQSRIFE